eukprot:TRINITY_DN13321_c0_g1_i1.p1 TRINITY_DN13321_c0_g1~~TRINITY_DN13321_c0_g1_i1.p1  ORF type:complete len:2760 (+),score=851.69 TRINITY_DN13321_c0_g1_i1:58-8337(+)
MAGRQPLLYGYKIALFYESIGEAKAENGRMGYIQSTWSTGPQSAAPVGMVPLGSRNATPPNFEDCIFQIVCGDGDIHQVTAKKSVEEVKFGQIIRLIHVGQGKPLCCSKRRGGISDKNSKKVTIEPMANLNTRRDWTSKWRIAPRYQVRGEGEKVCDGDNITLQPMISAGAHFLSVGEINIRGSTFLEASSVPKDCRDLDGHPREMGLTIKAYDTEDLEGDALRGGDCVMLYHKEKRGYLLGLTVDDDTSVMLQPDSLRTAVEDKDPATYLSNGMFIVEWEDPLQGGAMQAASWDENRSGISQRFRLRLLGNGESNYYLTLRRQSEEEQRLAERRRSSQGSNTLQAQSSWYKMMQSRKKAAIEEKAAERLPGWVTTLCKMEDLKSDKGTLFRFLQTGDNTEVELHHTSRVIIWADQAGMKNEPSESVFVHVGSIGSARGGFTVGCSSRPLQKDGFELQRVPPDAFLSLNSVLSQIPPINEYTRELEMMATEEPNTKLQLEPDRLLSSLEEMITRCFGTSNSSGADVLELDSTPDKGQQLLLVDQDVPRSCLRLLQAQERLPFSPEELLLFVHAHKSHWGLAKRVSIVPTEVQPPRSSLRIARLCYKLIGSAVRGSTELAARVVASIGEEGLEFIRSQGAFRNDLVGALPCLEALYENNRSVQLATPQGFVDAVCSEIKRQKWRCENLKLLPYIISTDTDVVERSCHRVSEGLLVDTDEETSPFIKMKYEDGKLMLRIPFAMNFADDDNETPSWIPIEQFCDVSDDIKCRVISKKPVYSAPSMSSIAIRLDDIYEYFRYQLILFSKLCLGKGASAKHRAATINSFIPQQAIMAVLCKEEFNKVVPDGLQCAFMKLACTVLLDDHPNKHYLTLHVVKVWDKFDEQPFDLNCPPTISPLKDTALEYIKGATIHDCHYPTKIEKSIGFLQILTLFVRSGFITQSEIFPLSKNLTAMLDGTNDNYLDPERPVPANALRKMYTEYSKDLLKLRDMIINCLSMLLDYKNSYDVARVLAVIKQHIDKGHPPGDLELPHLSQLQSFDSSDGIDEASESNYIENDNMLLKGFGMLKGGVAEGLGALSKMGNIVGISGEEDLRYPELNTLLEVLLDCAQYDYHPLRLSATRLLFRLTNRGPHLATVLKNAQLLSSDRSIKFYDEATALVEKLQESLEDSLDEETVVLQIKGIADELKGMCFHKEKHSVEQQWILFQLDFHSMLLSTPWMSQPDAYANAESHIVEAMASICQFLVAAVSNNPENKDALDDYIEMMAKLLPYDVGALELLRVLYEGCTKRCILAPDCLIRALLATPVRADYVDFLMDIMRPERRNLFRKQQVVYAHVSDMWTHECNFVGSSEMQAWTGRRKLRSVDEKLRAQEYLDPYGKVASHFLVLLLLRAISKGKEVVLKREIRADIWTEKYADPAEHIMNVCSKHDLPCWYRAPYVRFFTEVLVDDDEFVSSIVSQRLHGSKWGIVQILTLMKNELDRWPIEEPAKPKKEATPEAASLTLSPKSAGVKFESEPTPDVIAGVHLHGPQVFNDYLFFSVLPLVKHFVEAYLGRKENQASDGEEHHQIMQLISDLVSGFYRIATAQKGEILNVSPPGTVEMDEEACQTCSYPMLVKHAQMHPGMLHPAAGHQSKLLTPYIRTKIAEFLTLMVNFQDQINFQIPPSGQEGIATYHKQRVTPRVVTAEEELFIKWRECIKMVNNQPCTDPDKQFKTLSLLLLRKGCLGKEFIRKTLIGSDTEGIIFQRDHPLIQLDGLKVLSRLCDDYEPSCLGQGKGADDASIILPVKKIYVKFLRDEEAYDEDDRYALSDVMGVIDKQNTLNSFGMSEKLVSLVEAPSASSIGISKTTMTALITGSALLSGGNAEVQDSILKYFLKKNDENFFIHIRGQLRKFSDSLKDLTRTLKKEVTARTKENILPDDPDDGEVPINLKKEAIPSDIVETMRERYCINQMDVVMRFLQLLTEGHNLAMQNYLREQPDNHTSIDLVEATVTFLQQIKYLNRITSSIMESTLNTLIEFVQGPCQENQEELVSHNIGEQVCKILNDGPGPQVYKVDMTACNEPEAFEDLWTIRCAAVQLLVSCMEGCVPYHTAQLLLSTVRLEVLADNMVTSYSMAGLGKSGSLLSTAFGAGMDLMHDLIKPEGTGSELDDRLNLGCNIFIFFKVMLDAQALKEGETKEQVVWYDKEGRSIKHVLRRDENACFEHFNQIVATIEIARGDGVERVYFRVLMKSKMNLPERSKNYVKNEVQRDSGDGVRVADFFDKCIGLIHEIDYYEEMRNTRGLAIIHKFSVPLEWASLFLSFFINIYLLTTVYYYNDATEANVEPGDEEKALNIMGRGIIVLQCLQMIHFGMGPTRIYLDFKWREWEQEQEDAAMRESKANLSIHTVNRDSFGKDKLSPVRVFLQTLHMILVYYPFWQRGAYLICSFLGYYVSPMYYCIQPLQVISFSPKLMNVVLAVTTNGKSLLLTFGLMLIFVNIFASWAFFRFSKYFDENGDFGPGFDCDSLFRCWVLLMTYGLRQGGGMGDILNRPNWSDEGVGERITFDVLYFLVLIILFLNIVFGIIIDTFAELRERREFIDDDQQSKCFICGMERSVFDREAGTQGGFEHHYKNEHNMWTYLLFLHYISEKDVDSLTGQEKYVYDMVNEKDPGFLPIGKALVLRSQDTADPIMQILEKMVDRGQVEKLQAALQSRWQVLETKISSSLFNATSNSEKLPPQPPSMSPFTTPQHPPRRSSAAGSAPTSPLVPEPPSPKSSDGSNM